MLFNLGNHLVGIEGFGEIGRGTGYLSFHFVDKPIFAGQHNNGYVFEFFIFLDYGQNFVSIHFRQNDIFEM